MNFNPGLNINIQHAPLGISYGPGVLGPKPELRTLDAIRKSLRDPSCSGPDPVYAISMDVRKEEHEAVLQEKNLLFGIVTYAAGRLGEEPIRSQGHVHKKSSHSGWSPPELYEIWTGEAVIYIQEFAADEPGRCAAINARPGEIVVVPPGWAHATVSASPTEQLTFGAWCDREYSFEYDEVRARKGLAWYPLLDESGKLNWKPNPNYQTSTLIERRARTYPELDLIVGMPIYQQLERNPAALQWVSKPYLKKEVWENFSI